MRFFTTYGIQSESLAFLKHEVSTKATFLRYFGGFRCLPMGKRLPNIYIG